MKITIIGGRIGAAQTSRDGAEAPIQLTTRQRQALFALVVQRRTLSRDELQELLWDKPVGKKAVTNLMSGLKATLGADRIESDDIGYRFVTDPAEPIDLDVFNLLWEQAKQVMAHSDEPDHRQALRLYQLALDQWQEPALEGLPETGKMGLLRRSLLNDRLKVAEGLIETALDVGEHEGVEAIANDMRFWDLVRNEWHREHLRWLLMRALASTSRLVEARALYEELEKRLKKSGARPSIHLRKLYERLCAGEPEELTPAPEHPADRNVRVYGGDTKKISTIRLSYHLVGGRLSTAEERARVALIRSVAKQLLDLQRANEEFIDRAVGYAAREHGIVRVLAIGAHPPGPFSPHITLHRVAPGEGNIVYTSPLPSVVKYARDLLEKSPPGRGQKVSFIQADLLEPRTILENPAVRKLLEPGEPVLVAIPESINTVPKGREPQPLVQAVVTDIPRGSLVVMNVATDEGMTPLVAGQLDAIYRDVPETEKLVMRNRAAARTIFRPGLELLPPHPGATPDVTWIQHAVQPGPPHDEITDTFRALGGMGIKR
jgi:DNA-binding SARP family transcriptional activator